MGRVIPIHTAGELNPDSSAVPEQLDELSRVLNEEVEFGDPQNPNDPTSTTLAGDFSAGDHNGTLQNIAGSWVEIALEVTGLTIATCTHNLYTRNDQATVPVSGQPNCRWLVFGIMHDGTAADVGIVSSRYGVDVAFMGGDTVNVNDIQLRFNLRLSGEAITVGSSNPVRVTLFFTKATRGE